MDEVNNAVQEEWRILKYYNCGEDTETEEFKRYQVSTFGRIRNRITGEIIKFQKGRDGYLKGHIVSQTNIKKYMRLHRAVACTFIPNDNHTLIVNHKDLNKTNNNLTNLEWVTVKENNQHAIENGAFHKKIEYADIVQIDKDTFEIVNRFTSYQEAGEAVNIIPALIKKICEHRGKNYTAGGYIWLLFEEAKEREFI